MKKAGFRRLSLYFFSGFSRATHHSNRMMAAYGIKVSTFACAPAKNGFDASAHFVISLSKLVSTPAVIAMMMPASAPPAM